MDLFLIFAVFVLVLVLILAIYILRLKKERERDMQNLAQNQGDNPYVQSNISFQAVRTVYDEQQRLYRQEVITDRSNGRRIDGHPLRTREDWERWSVYDHQARDASEIVNKCIKELSSSFCSDPLETFRLAERNYRIYEDLCSRYGMWNGLIKDHAVYVPTYEQRQRSEQFINEIRSLIKDAEQRKAFSIEAEGIALQYIQSKPHKTAYRTDVTRKIGSAMEITPSEATKAIRVLCNRGVLRESKNEAGRLILRKARSRANAE